MRPIFYVMLSALAASLYTFSLRTASPLINQALAAIVVSFVAMLVGSIVMLEKARNHPILFHWKGLAFAVLAGGFAFCIDYFTLVAYSKRLPLSTGGPISVGINTALVTLLGVLTGDELSLSKIAGVTLVAAGAALLISASPR